LPFPKPWDTVAAQNPHPDPLPVGEGKVINIDVRGLSAQRRAVGLQDRSSLVLSQPQVVAALQHPQVPQ
jgi:hypothetical protein